MNVHRGYYFLLFPYKLKQIDMQGKEYYNCLAWGGGVVRLEGTSSDYNVHPYVALLSM